MVQSASTAANCRAGRFVVGLGLTLATLACGPDNVRARTIEAPETAYQEPDSVLLEPPVHLPSSSSSLDQVEVRLRLPTDAVIETVNGAGGEPTLRFPPGTIIDRVEWTGDGLARVIVDVRGASIDDEGRQWFHVYGRSGPRVGDALIGFEWPRDDAKAHSAATDAFIAALADTPKFARMAPAKAQARLRSKRGKNACLNCHALAEADAVHAAERVVARGTDASGFYVPQTIFADTVALEAYGRFDRNVDDPYVTIDCGAADVQMFGRHGGQRATCGDGTVPRGRLDLAAALAADDGRAQRLCAARQFLYRHLDEAGRTHFGASAAACSSAVASLPGRRE